MRATISFKIKNKYVAHGELSTCHDVTILNPYGAARVAEIAVESASKALKVQPHQLEIIDSRCRMVK